MDKMAPHWLMQLHDCLDLSIFRLALEQSPHKQGSTAQDRRSFLLGVPPADGRALRVFALVFCATAWASVLKATPSSEARCNCLLRVLDLSLSLNTTIVTFTDR